MIDILTKRPTDLFLSSACRRYFAWSNTKLRRATPTAFGKPSDAVMPGTVAHNRIQIDDESFESGTRTARLINPLAALDDIFVRADTRKVLSIGPRTEIELLHLVAVGVLLENIKAIDLISNSPWIELGDMHQLPYPDRSFDITISGWVLGYSRDPQKAIDEMVRVAVLCHQIPRPDAGELDPCRAMRIRSRHLTGWKASPFSIAPAALTAPPTSDLRTLPQP
ncbi:MAG: class I SAM-dependent methyltransferase [Rhodospirillaceae bacterium]|nr:class I SAM-dependent methyltransferase [Rhodospirillaceae bacterium]